MPDNLKKLQKKAKRRGIKNFRVKTEAELRELLEKRGTKSQPMHPILALKNIMKRNPEINVQKFFNQKLLL